MEMEAATPVCRHTMESQINWQFPWRSPLAGWRIYHAFHTGRWHSGIDREMNEVQRPLLFHCKNRSFFVSIVCRSVDVAFLSLCSLNGTCGLLIGEGRRTYAKCVADNRGRHRGGGEWIHGEERPLVWNATMQRYLLLFGYRKYMALCMVSWYFVCQSKSFTRESTFYRLVISRSAISNP